MTSHKTIEEYVLSMPGAKLDYPFGEGTAVYKLDLRKTSHSSGFVQAEDESVFSDRDVAVATSKEEKLINPGLAKSEGAGILRKSSKVGDKMFAIIAEGSNPVRLSLKCDPKLSILLQEKYESVMPGYHLNKKHWITIVVSGQLEWDEVKDLIRHSYILVTGESN